MTQETNVGLTALLDSGAEGVFMDAEFVRQHCIPTEPIHPPILARNVDGTANQGGTITRKANLDIQVGDINMQQEFLITNLGQHAAILGHPWLENWNPQVDWQARTMDIPGPGLQVASLGHTNKSTALAQAERKQDTRPLQERVPEFLHPYLSVFDEARMDEFPPARPYDHKIVLKDGFQPRVAKVYPMTQREDELLDKKLDEWLAKGYIKPSTSDQASSVFFVGKKDGDGWLCQDYVYLNN